MGYKIAIVGMGYVGFSNALLLAKHNKVYAIDILEDKVKMINDKLSPIKSKEIDQYLLSHKLDLSATTDVKLAFENADYIIIALPTDYDQSKKYFNTFPVEEVIKLAAKTNPNAAIIIRSTVPIGFTCKMHKKYNVNICFSPEFLREDRALHDSLYPSRIIVGCPLNDAAANNTSRAFGKLLCSAALAKNIPVIYIPSTEAEAAKLFSNAYLAMRVSFFNELDSFAENQNLCSKSIIESVCLDPRIGMYYNNPSFGYGGYCLPKDIRQLLANYGDTPASLIGAAIKSNTDRKDFIAQQIFEKAKRFSENSGRSGKPGGEVTVGIFRLAMKASLDDFRQSSVLGVIDRLKNKGAKVIIYEPALESGSYFLGSKTVGDICEFKKSSDLIAANRYDALLDDVSHKVYTRDLFSRD